MLRLLFALILVIGVHSQAGVEAAPRRSSHEFEVAPGLRARVNFWTDVFSKYGKYQSVVHHRNYPQAVFAVLDFTAEAETLSPRNFTKAKEKKLKSITEDVKVALLQLAAGGTPSSALGKRVQSAMELVPGGNGKFNEAVKEDLIRSQTGIRERYAEAVKRSGRYMPHLEHIFHREFGLPIEITRLPFIESSFDYTAYSSVGAAGIWQFMRTTGRLYLTINSYVDERRDPIEATRAAAQYLKAAYDRLGSWPLAITSYNHGVAGVARKVRQLGTDNIVEIVERPSERLFGFASTNFYPEFLAALEIYDARERHFPEVRMEPPLQMAQIKLPHSVAVHRVVQSTGVPIEELKRYNYAISDSVWKGRYPIPKGYTLKVPKDVGQRVAVLAQPSMAVASAPASSSIYGGVSYKVRSGDTIGEIAKKYHTSVKEIQRLNDMRGTTIRVGQVLTVRDREGAAKTTQEKKVSSEKPKSVPATASAKLHTVRPGDSLWTISRKYRVTLADLKSANPKMGSKIKPGQKVRIPG